jgi:hypothetical protein
MASGSSRATEVFLEVGKKRVFACALDWPGWCRSGKTDEGALAALAAYAERYAVVAREAGVVFPAAAGERLEVVERVPGTAGYTEFGVPGEVAKRDRDRLTAAEARRLADLVAAAWTVLDRVVAGAPAELRKGPRGGGRDRDKMVDHVLGAEVAYARKLGLKHRQPARDDARAIAALRDEIAAALRAPSDGEPLAAKGWLPRYAARRIAWHVLDHAWEIEDRSEPGG